MDERATRRRGRAGLLAAAGAFIVISLGGPLVLAAGGELGGATALIPLLWVVVIGGLVVWRRAHRRLWDARRAAAREESAPEA
jgi:fatty acid desaturase